MGKNRWLGAFRWPRVLAEPLEPRTLLSGIGLVGMQAYVSGRRPSSIVAADVNGDGWSDLAIADNSASGQISVHLNNRDGTFSTLLLSNVTPGNPAVGIA